MTSEAQTRFEGEDMVPLVSLGRLAQVDVESRIKASTLQGVHLPPGEIRFMEMRVFLRLVGRDQEGWPAEPDRHVGSSRTAASATPTPKSAPSSPPASVNTPADPLAARIAIRKSGGFGAAPTFGDH